MIVLTATMKAKEGSGNDLGKIIRGTAPKFLKAGPAGTPPQPPDRLRPSRGSGDHPA